MQKYFEGWIRISDTTVSSKRRIGEGNIPVVDLDFMGGKFECFQSEDLFASVEVGDELNAVEFQIQLDSIGNSLNNTTHLVRPVDGTIRIDGRLVQR